MAWSKIKTIIIVILLLTNLFLLFLMVGRQEASRRYEADTLSRTVEVFAQNDITIDQDILPRSMELTALAVTRDETAEAAAAQVLLGEGLIVSSTGGLSVYSSVAGNVSFRSNGDFSATLRLDWTDRDSRAGHAADLLTALGAQTWSVSADGDTVTAVQLVNGAPAFNVRLSFTYDGDYLTAISGRLFLGTAAADPEQADPVTVPTALLSFLDYIVENRPVFRSVTGMTAGYLTASALSDPARFTPCWLIETDTASYYVDALTGDVTRVS